MLLGDDVEVGSIDEENNLNSCDRTSVGVKEYHKFCSTESDLWYAVRVKAKGAGKKLWTVPIITARKKRPHIL